MRPLVFFGLLLVALVMDWVHPVPSGGVSVAIAPWIIPAIIAAVGAIGGAVKNRQSGGGGGNLTFEQGSPFWPGSEARFPNNVITGGGGGGGGGGAESTSSRSTSTTLSDITTLPVITPQYQPMESILRGMAQGRLEQPMALPRGYQASGTANINDAFDFANQSIGNRLVGSGLSGPMAAAAFGGSEFERAKTLAGFANELPLQERQLRNEDMELASNILAAFGRGQRQTGKSTTTSMGKSTSSGGGGGGSALPLPGDFLAQQYLQGQGQSGGGWLDKALGYAAALAGIYSTLRGSGGSK